MTTDSKQDFSIFHDADASFLRAWHRPYANLFKGARRVLDVGSGLMYFGELLREIGVEVTGVDIDPAMVQAGREKGFHVIQGDHRALVEITSPFDGVHISHVVEHLDGDALLDLIRTSISSLVPGGLLVIRTPNWSNRFVREHLFWMDHTHKRPYPRQLLVKILSDLGVTILEVGDEPFGVNDSYVIAQVTCNSSLTYQPIQFPPLPKRNLTTKLGNRLKVYIRRFLDIE
jgi:SAM-dependent methyltransferase